MKRRSIVNAHPIEFLPQQFFLHLVRETPCFSSASVSGLPFRHTPASVFNVPPTRAGVTFVALNETLARDGEPALAVAHTIRCCRWLNGWRRSLGETRSGMAHATSGDDYHDGLQPSSKRNGNDKGTNSHAQIHFYLCTDHRDQELELVQLLVRWRLLCLPASPQLAVAPFMHLLTPFRTSSVRELLTTLAGIARGVSSELLVSGSVFQSFGDNEINDDDGGSSCSARGLGSRATGLTWITTRFLIVASPEAKLDHVDSPANAAMSTTPSVVSPSAVPSMNDNSKEADRNRGRLSVAELVPQLQQARVAMLVRLSGFPHYDDRLLIRNGIKHLDLSTTEDQGPDGQVHARGSSSLRPRPVDSSLDAVALARFLDCCDHATGIVAVHSRDKLGLAAVSVACYLVKHAGLSVSEAVAWMRFCLPGAISRSLECSLGLLAATLVPTPITMNIVAPNESVVEIKPVTHINIGKMTLGRDALLGTSKDRAISSSRGKSRSTSQSHPTTPHHLLHAGQFTHLLATESPILASKLPRSRARSRPRPFTQGASSMVTRRLHGESGDTLALLHTAADDFHDSTAAISRAAERTAMHRFLHQQTRHDSSPSRPGGCSGAASLLRPTATAPEYRASGTADATF